MLTMKRFYWSLYSTPVSKGEDDYGYIEAKTLAAAKQMAVAEIMPDDFGTAKWQFIQLTKYYAKADGFYTFLLRETGRIETEEPRWYSAMKSK